MTAPQLKANFAVVNKYEAFYTGGIVQLSKGGEHLLCQCGTTVQCLDVQSGKLGTPIGSDEDAEITCFTLSPDDEILVTASRNLQLKQWNWKEKISTRTWRAIHTSPIVAMAFDATSTLLATGGADSSIKVWDVIKQYCTHNLRGHFGVISVLAFHPDVNRLQLFSSGDDYNIWVWNLQTSECIASLEGHYSAVTAIQFSSACDTVYTAGRDNVVIVWDSHKLSKLRTIPVYETIEALVLLPGGRKFPEYNVTTNDPHFITGGAKGILKVWNAATSRCVYPSQVTGNDSAEKSSEEDGADVPITAFQHNVGLDALTVVTFDHNITIHSLEDLSPKKHFVGYNDDILDMQFVGDNDSHLAVVTNSQLLKVFEVETWNCQVLKGHTDIVLCVGVKKGTNLFATGSKDNSIRVWQMNSETHIVRCVAVGQGHTHAVNSVSFSRLSQNFLVSGSHDCTLKLWPIPEPVASEILALRGSFTDHAHEKEINSVVITPNDKLVASGSQDKTAKLWSADKLSLLGVFRGHKRSIWNLQFSPVDQALATASADGTIKIWSLSDFSCVKTFEGHQSSVLRVVFVSRGMQLLSSGSDGLLKLWTIKSNECVGTWDEHKEKVWALVVSKDELQVVTGAGDSTICMWKDVTEEEQAETARKQEDFILQEQKLSNLMHGRQYTKAIGLAITLNQPFRVLGIFKDLLNEETGKQDAVQTLQKLREDQIDSVLGYSAKWNTNSKHCHVAQFVLNQILERFSPDQLIKMANVKATVEALLPYTERHFQRMNRLQQQTTFVNYTWQCMKMVAMLLPEPMESTVSEALGADNQPVITPLSAGLAWIEREGEEHEQAIPITEPAYESSSDGSDEVKMDNLKDNDNQGTDDDDSDQEEEIDSDQEEEAYNSDQEDKEIASVQDSNEEDDCEDNKDDESDDRDDESDEEEIQMKQIVTANVEKRSKTKFNGTKNKTNIHVSQKDVSRPLKGNIVKCTRKKLSKCPKLPVRKTVDKENSVWLVDDRKTPLKAKRIHEETPRQKEPVKEKMRKTPTSASSTRQRKASTNVPQFGKRHKKATLSSTKRRRKSINK